MEIKRENFKRISESRASRIMNLFNQLENLTNFSYYEYTDDEINRLFDELQKGMEKAKGALLSANAKKGKRIKL